MKTLSLVGGLTLTPSPSPKPYLVGVWARQ